MLRHRRCCGARSTGPWRKGKLLLYVLRGGQYEPLAASEVLPGVDLQLLIKFVSVQPMTRAVAAYRAALRGSPGVV